MTVTQRTAPSPTLREVLDALSTPPASGPDGLPTEPSPVASEAVVREWVRRLESEIAVREASLRLLRSAAQGAGPDPTHPLYVGIDHDSAVPERTAGVFPLPDPAKAPAATDGAPADLRTQVERLKADLKARDSALAAQLSDWEDLQRWVVQVEQKIEASGHYDSIFNDDSASGTDPAGPPVIPSALDSQAERVQLREEVEWLRARLEEAERQAAATPPAPDPAELDHAARQIERLKGQLEAERAAAAELRVEAERLDQERRRDREDYETAIATLGGNRTEGPRREAAPAAKGAADALDADQRIRALREHLAQIHNQEQENKDRTAGRLRGILGFGPKRDQR